MPLRFARTLIGIGMVFLGTELTAEEFHWERATPESQGMSEAKLERFQEILVEKHTKALLIIRNDRVMRPIGLKPTEWSVGYGKTTMVDGLPLVGPWGGGGYTARAAARVGRLMLREGNWQGKQLISKDAVRQTTSDSGFPRGCGMGWWTNGRGAFSKLPRDAFYAAGAAHQTVLVVPSLNLICVRNGQALVPRDSPEYQTARGPYLFDPLMEAVSDGVPVP